MRSISKSMLMVLILALASWAQTTNQSSPATTDKQGPAAQSEQKAESSCCAKMAGSKKGMTCCAHDEHASADSTMSCCSGKDGKSCMKADASGKASCSGGKCCNGKKAKDCCAGSGKNDKMAMACCGQGKCGMAGHDQMNMDK